jgi:hypothetical protein
MIRHYFTVAFRGLRKYRLQNLVSILGLTVGFAAFIFGTYWQYRETHYDTFHPAATRIFAITTSGMGKLSDGTDLEVNQLHKDDESALLEILPEIEKYTHISRASLSYKTGETEEQLMGLSVDSAFFDIFHASFLSGSSHHVPFDGTCIVLTEKTALRIMGTTDCIGELFSAKSSLPKIAGVIRDYPGHTGFLFDFLQLSHLPRNHMSRSTFYVRLHEKAGVASVRQRIETHKSVATVPWNPKEPENWSFRLRTLPDVHLTCSPELKGRFLNIRLLASAGLLAMLCALMNALVLFIAQQLKKRQKHKVFRSMGATTSYLFGKTFLDLAIPLFIALILTWAAITTLFPPYQSYTQWQGYGVYENYSNRIDLHFLLLYALKWISLTLLLFFLPASLCIRRIIRAGNTYSFTFLRNTLIISQIFIGCFFFFTSLSLYKQVSFTQRKDKGIHVGNIIRIDAGYYSKIDFAMLKSELLRSPHIDDATCTVTPVLMENGDHYQSYMGTFCFHDRPEEIINALNVLIVEANYFDFFGIRFQEGHGFAEKTGVVINATLMAALNDRAPPGKAVKAGVMEDARLSGIIKDYNYSPMQYPVNGLLFHLQEETPQPFAPYQYVYIKTLPENEAKALEHAEKTLERMETADVAPGKRFLRLTDMQDGFNRPEKILFRIFGLLSLVSILVVSFGIYSLVTLTIEQRRKEIAIRKINGAEIPDILLLFIRNYLCLVIAGNVLSLPVAYYFTNNWMENYAYRTDLSWWLFAVVFAVTCLLVVLSIFEKIRTAAAENPADVVKSE